MGGREKARHRGFNRSGRTLRRARRRGRRGSDRGTARLQTRTRQDQYRTRPRQRRAGRGLQEGGHGMTNTLHRFGDADSFRDDYVVFAIASKGRNDQDALPKLRRFLEIALEYKPVNLGDARHGGALRPSQKMTPLSPLSRDMKPGFEAWD